MFPLDDLIGLPYVEGRQDCFTCVRNFFRKCGLLLPNFARPQLFWQHENMDLYAHYRDFGFHPIFDQEPEPGDVLFMPLMARVNSHAVVAIGQNQILHHPPGQVSRIDPYRPKWSNRTTIHARNPEIHEMLKPQVNRKQLHEVINAHVLRNPEVQEHLANVLRTGG